MKTKILPIIKRLFLVPVCASCRQRLSPIIDVTLPTYGKVCFCAKCANEWHKAKSKMCPICANTAEKCECTPKFFKKYQEYIPSVCFYDPESHDTPSKAILTAKKRNDPELFEFFAIELVKNLKALLDKANIDPKDCIVTWIPRQRKSISKHGFDQGERLADHTAKLLGADVVPIFSRKGGEEQKSLDKAERKLNAEGSIILKRKYREKGKNSSLAGKNIIILDDVITSGATMKRGFLLLLPLKPGRIIAATISKTANKSQKTN